MDDPPSTLPPARTPVPPVIAHAGGASPAPIFLRVIALALDVSLAGLVAFVILTRIVLPQNHPDAMNIISQQWQTNLKEWTSARAAGTIPQLTYNDDAKDIIWETGATFFLTLFLYFFGSEMAMEGASLGKRAFGLRAARWATGVPPLFLESFSRCVFKVTSLLVLLPFLFMANIIPIFVKSSGRAGHDLLAGTIVTRDAPPPKPEKVEDDESPWG